MSGSMAVAHQMRISKHDRLLLAAILASGAAAAALAMPVLWAVTPLVALLVFWSARRAAPADVIHETPTELPPRLEQLLDDAIVQLPRGDARQLLANIVRAARPLFAERQSAFDADAERETRAHVTDLVTASCETALELHRLDGAAPNGAPVGVDAASGLDVRYQRARAELVTRLRDAATALSELYASGLEHGTPASDRAAELADTLRADAIARGSALREMDALLLDAPLPIRNGGVIDR